MGVVFKKSVALMRSAVCRRGVDELPLEAHDAQVSGVRRASLNPSGCALDG
ncbi:MAG: hypothetical protein OXC15_18120 [Rhodospirillaceae bacterium]|nr:hypothetical protein [Rhodospirillaceae bacterium]